VETEQGRRERLEATAGPQLECSTDRQRDGTVVFLRGFKGITGSAREVEWRGVA
jgi:hypothetical protein